jgi:hypothetical protein
MKRALTVCAVLLAGHAAAAEPAETVVRLTVRPAPAPKPALKYQLLPELAEMNPGNPIQAYAKCFAEQYNFWRTKEEMQKREQWQTMPLGELPLKEMTYFNRRGPLGYADWAARLDTPDWQILLQLKRDGPLLLLPDIQGLRELGGALKVRFRIEVAERRFDDAVYTAKTMFALSRHLGEHPTLISELVGIAVGSLAVGPLEEMIPQLGSPNLYWALTDLPHPFIDLRKGVQGSRVMMTDIFAPIDEEAPMTEAQVQRAVERIRRMVKEIQLMADVSKWLNRWSTDEEHVRATRKRLIDAGIPEGNVKQFPATQVILLDEKLEYSVWHDEVRKAMSLPYWQAVPILAAASTRKASKDSPFRWMDGGGYANVKRAQARLEQRLGLLRCVEALRLYAAEHDSKLPAKLDEIKLPLPVDAVTGKPFVYELKEDKATVRGTPPKGMENNAAYNVRYEVTIAK